MNTPILIRTLKGVLAAAICGLSLSACADFATNGSGPSYLVIEGMEATAGGRDEGGGASLESDVRTNGSVYTDFGTATIRNVMKNQITTTAPTPHSSITLNHYRVRYRRTDGQNREGIDVPYGFDGATTVTIAAGVTGTISFDLVRLQSKLEPPLRTLIGQGGSMVISMIAEITFYGANQAGDDVVVAGTIDVKFADYGDDEE